MIVKPKTKIYSSKKSMIVGRGFVDNLKGIGSYIYQNKDLIARPMLGAMGDIGALAMTEAAKALIRKMTAEKHKGQLDQESKQILDSLKVPQISGSGLKRF